MEEVAPLPALPCLITAGSRAPHPSLKDSSHKTPASSSLVGRGPRWSRVLMDLGTTQVLPLISLQQLEKASHRFEEPLERVGAGGSPGKPLHCHPARGAVCPSALRELLSPSASDGHHPGPRTAGKPDLMMGQVGRHGGGLQPASRKGGRAEGLSHRVGTLGGGGLTHLQQESWALWHEPQGHHGHGAGQSADDDKHSPAVEVVIGAHAEAPACEETIAASP